LGKKWVGDAPIALKELVNVVKKVNTYDYKLLTLLYGNIGVMDPY
jgi:hypothetical protein